MINQVTLPECKSLWDSAFAANTLHVPFLSHAWHADWNSIFGKEYSPLYLHCDNAVIAPLVVKDQTVIFSGGEEGADYLDLIGPEQLKESAWAQILPFLKKNNVATIALRNIPENSPTVSFFRKLSPAIIEKEDSTPHFILPPTWNDYVESLDRKSRHEMERKIRKFEREHIDAEIHQSDDPASDIDILIDLMLKDEDKKNFLTPTMQTFFRTVATSQKEKISLLYISAGDKKIAATMAFIEDNITYLYNSGFDKDCCANAGFYLKAMSIKRAIEQKFKIYNFLQGQERYKYELGGKDFFVYKITLTL